MYTIIRNTLVLVICIFSVVNGAHAQWPKMSENHFGFLFKPLIPFGVVGDRPFDIVDEQIGNFETTISPIFGYTYGGAVRIGISERMAIESGINYTKRNFRADYNLPDSSITGTDEVGFVNFEVPVNFLVYIKLGQKFYMNTSLGASVNYNPSNIRSLINPSDAHLFILEGRRFQFFNYDVNANVGFEYRTEKKGYFYLGISAKLPLIPAFQLATEYRNDLHSQVAYGQVEGATFSFDIKYFFYNAQNKGTQFKPGPIEQ